MSYGSAVTAALAANPESITSGQSSLLTWSSTGSSICTGTGFSSGNALSGSVLVAPTSTTNYYISCSSAVGTWQYQYTDVTDLMCPPGGGGADASQVQNTYPTCPSNPQGTSCSGSYCEINTAVGCNINTTIYQCLDANGNPLTSANASTTVTVADVLDASCAPTPATTSVYTSVSWGATVIGGTGPYSYAWSGTDDLTGDTAHVSKTYSTVGTKGATLVVTSGDEHATSTCSTATITEGTNTDLSANTPTLYSGLNEEGNTVTFLGTITNVGDKTVSAPFQNRFQVDLNGDGSYELNLDASSASYTIGLSGSATVVSPAWEAIPLGAHKVRFCSDLPPDGSGSVAESNENNNCSADLSFGVGSSLLTLDIESSVQRVKTGSTATITWSAQNADSCTVSGPGLSSTGTSGSQSVTVTGESTYTITCLRGTSSKSSSVTVRLAPKFEEI